MERSARLMATPLPANTVRSSKCMFNSCNLPFIFRFLGLVFAASKVLAKDSHCDTSACISGVVPSSRSAAVAPAASTIDLHSNPNPFVPNSPPNEAGAAASCASSSSAELIRLRIETINFRALSCLKEAAISCQSLVVRRIFTTLQNSSTKKRKEREPCLPSSKERSKTKSTRKKIRGQTRQGLKLQRAVVIAAEQ